MWGLLLLHVVWMWNIVYTVKPVLSNHSKIDKTKILLTNGSLMQVKSIAECSLRSILQYFWPALSDTVISLENQIFIFLRVAILRPVLLYMFSLFQARMMCLVRIYASMKPWESPAVMYEL